MANFLSRIKSGLVDRYEQVSAKVSRGYDKVSEKVSNKIDKVSEKVSNLVGSSSPAKAPKSTPTTIFSGMTKAQAEEYGLLDEFNAANADGDDKISEDEFSTYEANKTEVPATQTSSSGKRVANNGVYIIQSGDRIRDIAADFGVDEQTLRTINQEYLVRHNNMICVGDEFIVNPNAEYNSLTQEQVVAIREENDLSNFNKSLNSLNGDVHIPSETKTVLARIFGKEELANSSEDKIMETLINLNPTELVNAAINAKNEGDIEALNDLLVLIEEGIKAQVESGDISNEFATAFEIIKTAVNGGTLERTFEALAESLDLDPEAISKMTIEDVCIAASKLQGKDKVNVYVEAIRGSGMLPPGFDKEGDIVAQFYEFLGLDKQELEALLESDINEFNRKINEALANKKSVESDFNNENSLCNKHLKALREGKKNFTTDDVDYIKNVLHKDIDNLTDADLKKVALHRVEKSIWAAGLLSGQKDAVENNRTALERAMTNAAADIVSEENKPEFARDAARNKELILTNTAVSEGLKTKLANESAEDSEKLGFNRLNNNEFQSFIDKIFQHADEEHVQSFIKSNADRIDVIEQVINNLAANNQDPSRQGIYTNAQHTIAQVKQEIEETGSYSGVGGAGRGVGGLGVRNGSYNNQASIEVDELRAASANYYSERTSVTNPIEASKPDQPEHLTASFLQNSTVDIQTLKRSTSVEKLSEDIKNFSNLEPKEQSALVMRLNGSSTQHLINLLLSGDADVQNFVFPYVRDYINVLVASITKDDLPDLNNKVLDELNKYAQKKVIAGLELSENERAIIDYCNENNIVSK